MTAEYGGIFMFGLQAMLMVITGLLSSSTVGTSLHYPQAKDKFETGEGNSHQNFLCSLNLKSFSESPMARRRRLMRCMLDEWT